MRKDGNGARRGTDRARRVGFRPRLDRLEPRRLLSTFVVDNTADSGAGSLRQAILDADAAQGASDIVFDIPASTAADLAEPVPGFDPTTQDWTITLASPLPAITNSVTIDGYSQGEVGVPFRYPNAVALAVQTLTVLGSPTGGSFTLTTLFPLPSGTTEAIPYNANAGTVQAALEAVIGAGNVTVTGGPAPDNPFTITFGGAFARQLLLPLQSTSNLTGGTNPGISIEEVSVGGTPVGTPTLIVSTPNNVIARDGNDAHARVIIDGSHTGGATGFVLDTSHAAVRGLIIDGFGVGVSVPSPSDVGNIIQGNYIGKYLVYPVDPNTGAPLPAPNNVELTGSGNTLEGVDLSGNNTTVGGTNTQENNVISGNGLQGIIIESAGTGNVVEGNQIGIISTATGRYFQVGNGADGVLVYGESNQIGGPVPAAGNLISANFSNGIRLSGSTATRNIIAANIIGLGPGGGYLFGTGNPGNGDEGDGVHIEGSSRNQIGGPTAASGNTISSNFGSGVFITDLVNGTSVTRSIGNIVQNNLIGVTSDGSAAKGNAADGVTIDSNVPLQPNEPPGLTSLTVIGPGNVISGNFRGVRISGPGPGAKGVVVRDNLVGTDLTGSFHLGNAEQGVLIDNATDDVIEGTSSGSQVISGNNVGVEIEGQSATDSLVSGNFIGTDRSGTFALSNAQQGVLIQGAAGNTVGGTTAAARNVISANYVGVLITGPGAVNNFVLGNYIGTDATGLVGLGNEQEGVRIDGASDNTIGGTSPAATNVISGNEWGVTITASTRIAVQGNLIGTGANGLTPIGNLLDGVLIENDSANNLIGGLGKGQGNTIAYNGADGVQIVGLHSTGNGILSNRIFANGALGIDLVPPIPPAGPHMGPNNLQPAPVLTSLSITSTGVVVQGTLSSMPDTSYLIQFFLDAPGSAVTDGELIGSTTVVTDQNGNASFSVAIAVNIPSGDGVRATATGPGNNTSEFSAEVVNTPAVLEFSMANYVVNAAAGVAVITVDREGGGGVVTVNYATAGGTAVPGVNYTPVSSILTFGFGVTVETFKVPIIDVPTQKGDKTVGLLLTDPSPPGEATLGVQSSAILTITPPIPPPAPPVVTGVQLITNRQQIVERIVVSFSELLNPTTAVNLLNYNYSVTTAGRDHIFGTRDDLLIPINTAVYDPSNLTVTLTLGRGIHPPTPFRLGINQLTDVPGAGVGVANFAGELLSTYVVILRGNAGGIVSSKPKAAVTRHVPMSVAAIDAVLETSTVGGTGATPAARRGRVRIVDGRR
jgi:titin